MQARSRQFLVLTTLVAMMVAAGAMAASGAGTVKITNCNKASSRPKQVTLTCGDGNTALSGLRWSSFGGASANAVGTFETNTCTPNCARRKSGPLSGERQGIRHAQLQARFEGLQQAHAEVHGPQAFVGGEPHTLDAGLSDVGLPAIVRARACPAWS